MFFFIPFLINIKHFIFGFAFRWPFGCSNSPNMYQHEMERHTEHGYITTDIRPNTRFGHLSWQPVMHRKC